MIKSILISVLLAPIAYATPFVQPRVLFEQLIQSRHIQTLINGCEDTVQQKVNLKHIQMPNITPQKLTEYGNRVLLVCEYGEQTYDSSICENQSAGCSVSALIPVTSGTELPQSQNSAYTQQNTNQNIY